MEFIDLWLIPLLFSTLRVSLPLIVSAQAGIFSERSGVINLAIEAQMLLAAFLGATLAYQMQSPWWGLLGGVLGGVLIAIILAACVLHLSGDQIVVGMALNILVLGVTPYFCKWIFDNTSSTPGLETAIRWSYAPYFFTFVCVVFSYVYLRYTKYGLRLIFAGEKPQALEASGDSVIKNQWIALLYSGVFSGLAGVFLSTFLSSNFSKNMTGGRGFMAIAAMIIGRWQPEKATLACLFFGFCEALQIRLQGAEILGFHVPPQWVQSLPYVATLIFVSLRRKQ